MFKYHSFFGIISDTLNENMATVIRRFTISVCMDVYPSEILPPLLVFIKHVKNFFISISSSGMSALYSASNMRIKSYSYMHLHSYFDCGFSSILGVFIVILPSIYALVFSFPSRSFVLL